MKKQMKSLRNLQLNLSNLPNGNKKMGMNKRMMKVMMKKKKKIMVREKERKMKMRKNEMS